MAKSRESGPTPGLRERKKLATRVAMRKAAYRLFREQGYEQTTVAQIAAAAEVSPATFFRYFATKEALLLDDDYDPMFFARVGPVDPHANVGAALLRRAADLFEEMDPDTLRTEMERASLLYSTPALRAAQADQQERTAEVLVEKIRANATGPVDLGAVRVVVGALVGAMMAGVGFDGGDMTPTRIRAVADILDAGLRIAPRP